MVSSRSGISSESSARLTFFLAEFVPAELLVTCFFKAQRHVLSLSLFFFFFLKPLLKHWFPAFLAPGTGFMEDHFSTDKRWGECFQDDSSTVGFLLL